MEEKVRRTDEEVADAILRSFERRAEAGDTQLYGPSYHQLTAFQIYVYLKRRRDGEKFELDRQTESVLYAVASVASMRRIAWHRNMDPVEMLERT